MCIVDSFHSDVVVVSQFLRILQHGVNKKSAVESLLKRIGIRGEECIAFGDNLNDLEILQYAGIGVCMGNGSEELKQTADYITDSLNYDGIIHALKHFDMI